MVPGLPAEDLLPRVSFHQAQEGCWISVILRESIFCPVCLLQACLHFTVIQGSLPETVLLKRTVFAKLYASELKYKPCHPAITSVHYMPGQNLHTGFQKQTSKEMARAFGVSVAQCSKRPCMVVASYGGGSTLPVALNFSSTTSRSTSSTKSMLLMACSEALVTTSRRFWAESESQISAASTKSSACLLEMCIILAHLENRKDSVHESPKYIGPQTKNCKYNEWSLVLQ